MLLGRPVLWGLALGGQEGVHKVHPPDFSFPSCCSNLLVSGVLQKLQMHDERSWNGSWLFAVADSAICSGGITFADASNINSFVADVQVLETLRKELRLSMALMGCPSLAHLNRRMVLAPWEHPSARL